jgi:anti-sigma B factor antagonist
VDATVAHHGTDIASVAFSGRLDFLSSSSAREHFSRAIADGHRKIVVDLSRVTFVDSSGLGALVAGLKSARQASGDLRIASAPEQAMAVLKLTSLDRVFRIHATVEDAIATF